MRRIERLAKISAICGLGILVLASSAIGQTAPKPSPTATAPPPGMTAPSVATTPSRTTASFGDWTLRCDRNPDATPPRRSCELGFAVQNPGEQNALAQIAVGRLASAEPLRFTAMLPPNVTLPAGPKLFIDGKEPASVDLTWVRCLPGGCFATADVSDDLLRKLRSSATPGRFEYRDAANREVKLPVSFRGFGEAFDALGKEVVN
jgi:invasion protein IalB